MPSAGHAPTMKTAATTLWALLLLLAASCARDAEPQAATAAAQAFYAVLEELSVSGAPSAEELDALSPCLGDELERLLKAARMLHDRERARFPDEKPPFNDGDLFSSLFEGPTGFVVGTPIRSGATWRVPVALSYQAAGSTTDWTDTVVVARESGQWVVTDVIYGGAWDFALRGSLVANLRAELAHDSAAQ